MSEIRVELAPEFKGETVVLLTMDGDGLDAFRLAVAEAIQNERGSSSQLMHADATHIFAVEDGKAEIELQKGRVTWRLSPSKLVEGLSKSWMR